MDLQCIDRYSEMRRNMKETRKTTKCAIKWYGCVLIVEQKKNENEKKTD